MKVPCQYTLPQVEFVGGSTQDFSFCCRHYKTGSPMDMSGCKAEFAIIDYLNKQSETLVWSGTMTLRERDSMCDELFISVPPSATLDLWGKYIYQISIRDIDGVIEIPKQGLMFITSNIHKGFVRGG